MTTQHIDAGQALRRLLRGSLAKLVSDAASRELVDRRAYAVALVDGDGRVIVATETVSVANVEAVARTFLDYFDRLEPGDIAITNDPYSGGTRVQEHFMASPVCGADGRLLGMAVVCAPFVDVGGMRLGNEVPEAGDLWTEGVRTRPIRLRRAGAIDHDVIRLLQLNSRVPVLVAADLETMSEVVLAAARDAADALSGELPGALLAAGAARLKEALDGGGSADGRRTMTSTAGDTGELSIALALSVADGAVIADFTGSSKQLSAGNLNATIHNTTSAVARALSEVTGCELDSALTGALRVVAPQGSLLNCAYPAPVGGSVYGTCAEVFQVAKECLEQALVTPDRDRGGRR